jgi:hypothetical protein
MASGCFYKEGGDMNVYYDPGIWHRGKGGRGRRQAAGWRFEYAGMRCVVPAVYRFPKGVVFDIMSFTDEARLREFFEKYENTEEKLTPSQRRLAAQEHPLQPVPVNEVWLNGKKAQSGISYSHALSIPWARHDDALGPLRRAYPALLRDGRPFACQRVRVDYSEAAGGIETLLRRLRLNGIRGMRLVAASILRFHPLNISFELSSGDAEKQIDFSDAAGKRYRLYISGAKTHEPPFDLPESRRLYAALASYEIEPALPEGASISFCNYAPLPRPVSPPSRAIGGTNSASSIGIIGGAHGPTAIFLGTDRQRQTGPHGLPLHTCFSVPSLSKNDVWTFILEGLNVKHLDGQTIDLGCKTRR